MASSAIVRLQLSLTFLAALLISPVGVIAAADLLTVVTFNVESGDDTDPALVAQDIVMIGPGVDLWGLTEVADKSAANTFRQAASGASKYRYILGESGGEDRLTILYNLDTLKFKGVEELDRLPGSRKPLAGHFQHKDSGVEFLFVVNHFNRGDAKRRQKQAERLRQWTKRQELPVILAGDFNFDYNPKTEKGNKAFDLFMQGTTVHWHQPKCVSAGNCPRTGTQCDSRYNSILDFVFTGGPARDWEGESQVIFAERAYCARDRKGYADHRPVMTVLTMN